MKKFFLALILTAAVVGASFAYNIEPNGVNQADLYKLLQNLVAANSNRTYGTAGFAATSTTTATFDIGTTFAYTIDGAFYSKAASATIADVSAAVQAKGTTCYYLFSVDSAGDVTTTKGVAVAVGGTPKLPEVPASQAPFASLKVAVTAAATSTFTLGTTATAGITGQTLTIANLANTIGTSLTGF